MEGGLDNRSGSLLRSTYLPKELTLIAEKSQGKARDRTPLESSDSMQSIIIYLA
jgi:hypothetical protein